MAYNFSNPGLYVVEIDYNDNDINIKHSYRPLKTAETVVSVQYKVTDNLLIVEYNNECSLISTITPTSTGYIYVDFVMDKNVTDELVNVYIKDIIYLLESNNDLLDTINKIKNSLANVKNRLTKIVSLYPVMPPSYTIK